MGGSGTDSETEAPGSPARRAPVLERLLSQAKAARVRRGTECELTKERSQFMRRKQEHKRRFLKGVPERGRMTMFDLIYYNPENGPRMSIEEEDKADSPEREGMNRVRQDRSRATSECEDALVNTRARLGVRQRTCSEGSGGDLRTELVRQRFLSGAVRSVPGPTVSNSDASSSSQTLVASF